MVQLTPSHLWGSTVMLYSNNSMASKEKPIWYYYFAQPSLSWWWPNRSDRIGYISHKSDKCLWVNCKRSLFVNSYAPWLTQCVCFHLNVRTWALWQSFIQVEFDVTDNLIKVEISHMSPGHLFSTPVQATHLMFHANFEKEVRLNNFSS